MRKRFCFGCHQEVRERRQAWDGHKYCVTCFPKIQEKRPDDLGCDSRTEAAKLADGQEGAV